MQATFVLDRVRGRLFDARGRRLDPASRSWRTAERAERDAVTAQVAAAWLQRESGAPLRVRVGVIGPREAGAAQLGAFAA